MCPASDAEQEVLRAALCPGSPVDPEILGAAPMPLRRHGSSSMHAFLLPGQHCSNALMRGRRDAGLSGCWRWEKMVWRLDPPQTASGDSGQWRSRFCSYGGQRGAVAVCPRLVAFRSPHHGVHEVKANRPADHDIATKDTHSPHSQAAALAGRRNCSRSPPCQNALLDGQRHGSQHI
jgi:hypothetical protein